MSRLSRRELMHAGLGAAAWVLTGRPSRAVAGQSAERSGAEGGTGPLPPTLDLPVVGRVKPRPGKDIAASPLGVGFETLDRRHFDPERTYPYVARLGVKWARCQTGWGRTERTKCEFDFTWLDAVVDSLRSIGVQPWFNLGYGNRLYMPEAPDEAAVGWAPVFSDEAKQAWLRYVDRIATRYADRVTHWEIWNEPNITNFWRPAKPNAADYVALVRMTAPEIRKRVPKAVIIGGAFAGMPIDYLKACLDAGLADLVDKVSYHPYRPVPEAGYEKEVKAFRDALARHNPSVALWQGENGAPSVKGGAGALANLDWNELKQAKWLLRRILGDLRLGIELTSYFLVVDLVGYRGSTNYKGLLRGTSYTPKPSYFAYQHLCALFDAETRKADLAVEVEPTQQTTVMTAAFTRHGRPVYAYWAVADLMKEFSPGRITLRMPTVPGVGIQKPVLIDLLAGSIHAVGPGSADAGGMVFKDLPLQDYPLLLADATVQ